MQHPATSRILMSLFMLVFHTSLWATDCSKENTLNPNSRILASHWGSNLNNNRFQSAQNSELSAADVPRLKLKWAYYLPPRFPGISELRSQAAVTEDTVYLGAQDGTVYALDTETGCTRWTYTNDTQVRSAITLGQVENAPRTLFFGDDDGLVTALNATTGEKL